MIANIDDAWYAHCKLRHYSKAEFWIVWYRREFRVIAAFGDAHMEIGGFETFVEFAHSMNWWCWEAPGFCCSEVGFLGP